MAGHGELDKLDPAIAFAHAHMVPSRVSSRLLRSGHPLRDHWIEDHYDFTKPRIRLINRPPGQASVTKLCPWRTIAAGDGFAVPVFDHDDHAQMANRLGVKMCYESKRFGTRWTQRRRGDLVIVLREA